MINFIVTGKFRIGAEVENPKGVQAKGVLWKPPTTEDSSS